MLTAASQNLSPLQQNLLKFALSLRSYSATIQAFQQVGTKLWEPFWYWYGILSYSVSVNNLWDPISPPPPPQLTANPLALGSVPFLESTKAIACNGAVNYAVGPCWDGAWSSFPWLLASPESYWDQITVVIVCWHSSISFLSSQELIACKSLHIDGCFFPPYIFQNFFFFSVPTYCSLFSSLHICIHPHSLTASTLKLQINRQSDRRGNDGGR